MTNTRKFPLTELADAVAPVRLRHRELIDAAVAWHAARGHEADPDHFALICAGAERGEEAGVADEPGLTATRWTRIGVYATVRCGIPNWCSSHSCIWPEGLPRVMWAWFDFLHATGRLDPDSDPVAELHKPLACYGWLDQDGRPLPVDAPRVIECECFLPYRATAQLLVELVRLTERSGEDPLDPLRRVVGRPVPPRPGWAGPFADDPDADLDDLWWSDAAGDG